ncbi:cytochrome ubiquinol oxidase subunit I [Paenibacillus sacheonensis]|uniref:Cytochrome ubiquinol oxidase subunit I n=1 Tax=Paenibacillus sacheonensis TaxID=742054 RepID=A0A7X4YSP3_9BACL|nr:cytochrome ubiquinol oxidase subunit I [Paenibacillus sacheonensis]MBM7568172.1 cytochrome d ubiquinol oxidase subunit I [Paenibacillus sacheonensis]NBC71828.1 cytochrome ubiquinol oxidase subunit I [Paenibacillus sacheonensis]
MLLSGYDPVMYSRILTGVTLAFHIIFATIGVGVPLMIALAEWIGIKRGDDHYLLMARRWARGFVITVAVGVVTGTAIGLQLSLLWPTFMRVAGQSIALPLFMETFAFFFEAIFLGIYLYTWERFKKKTTHLLLLIPVVLGSSASACFITIVNAFMNSPAGVTVKDGKIVDISPFGAMLSPAMPTKVSHVLVTAYLTCAFVLAAISAWSLLKGRNHVYYKKALKLTMMSAFVFIIASAVIGDLSGKYLAKYQPEKLAAMEWHFDTSKQAPLVLGGILTDDNEIKYGFKIPFALSILAHGLPNAEVTGLNDIPKDEHPPLYIHYLFDLKMGFVAMMVVIAGAFMLLLYRKRSAAFGNKWMLRGIILAAPLAMMTIEHGWIFSEVGRQPWLLRGIMRTSEGATTSDHVDTMLIVFVLLYVVLGVSAVTVLIRMFRSNRAEDEIAAKGFKGGDEL